MIDGGVVGVSGTVVGLGAFVAVEVGVGGTRVGVDVGGTKGVKVGTASVVGVGDGAGAGVLVGVATVVGVDSIENSGVGEG